MAKTKLTPELEQKLIQSEAEMQEILLEVDRLEECDTDCQEFRAQINEQIRKSVKLRENFGRNSK